MTERNRINIYGNDTSLAFSLPSRGSNQTHNRRINPFPAAGSSFIEDNNSFTEDRNSFIEDNNSVTEDRNSFTEDNNSVTEDRNLLVEKHNPSITDTFLYAKNTRIDI
jgi:hypothetical protein